MIYGTATHEMVSTRLILAAIVTLAGIVLLAFGYYGGNTTMTYAGLAMTLAGIALELVFTLIGSRPRPR